MAVTGADLPSRATNHQPLTTYGAVARSYHPRKIYHLGWHKRTIEMVPIYQCQTSRHWSSYQHGCRPSRDMVIAGPKHVVSHTLSNGSLQRLVPFGALAWFSELSELLPPGPANHALFLASAGLLLLVSVWVIAISWSELPEWTNVIAPICFTGSAVLMLLASGSSVPSGLVGVFLIPLIWTALYQRARDSALVVGAVVLGLIAISLDENSASLVIRRIVLWGGLGALLVVMAHSLRSRLLGSISTAHDRARKLRWLMHVTKDLTAILDPGDVVQITLKRAEELIQPTSNGRRAHYYRIDGRVARTERVWNEADGPEITFPLDQHPELTKVIASGRGHSAPIDVQRYGSPSLRDRVAGTGSTHATWVPVSPDGVLHGVLALATTTGEMSDETVSTLRALASVMELALANASAHQAVTRLTLMDDLTGVANRRGFEHALSNRSSREPFVLLSIDVDNLKAANDTYGHATGDALLSAVAGALRNSLRRGDVVARVGGDEFAVIVHGAHIRAGCHVARRMLKRVAGCNVPLLRPSISIGLAQGDGPSDAIEVLSRADKAMYRAKRQGGMRLEVDDEAALVALA